MKNQIQIKIFAGIKEALGKDEISFPFSSPLTVGKLKEELIKAYPQVASTIKTSRIALNMRFASEEDLIPSAEDLEIALIPPVSGG